MSSTRLHHLIRRPQQSGKRSHLKMVVCPVKAFFGKEARGRPNCCCNQLSRCRTLQRPGVKCCRCQCATTKRPTPRACPLQCGLREKHGTWVVSKSAVDPFLSVAVGSTHENVLTQNTTQCRRGLSSTIPQAVTRCLCWLHLHGPPPRNEAIKFSCCQVFVA